MRNLIGHRNGRLVVTGPAEGRAADGHRLWVCLCDCGETCIVQSNNIIREAGTKSCGCLNREHAAANSRNIRWNLGKTYPIQDGERIYKTKHSWAKAVLRFFGNKCQKCGWNKARCDAHHKIPKSEGGKNTIANGIVLCPNCHRIEHCKSKAQ